MSEPSSDAMPGCRVILQARMSSTRLPGKSLLPVGGLPLVLFCAKRVMGCGCPVWVATSDQQEDDPLAAEVTREGIPCVRGPLHDVHQRFLSATQDLPSGSLVVRLTADNPFPDAGFVREIIRSARMSGAGYTGVFFPESGLPYGMSAEVFSVDILREVRRQGLTQEEKEHVTLAIRRQVDVHKFTWEAPDRSHLRCTIDTPNDYHRLKSFFAEIDNPLQVSSTLLCQKLFEKEQLPGTPVPGRRIHESWVSVATLGTAQMGLPKYGVTRTQEGMTKVQASEILDLAVRNGITHIDTARAYGTAEATLGQVKKSGMYAQPCIVTKLDPFLEMKSDVQPEVICSRVQSSVRESAGLLDLAPLPVVMLHRWAHRHAFQGEIWTCLKDMQARGDLLELGASVSTPHEALEALSCPEIRHLQIPFNLLDRRWHQSDFLKERHKRKDLIVYGRSAFLQGLLLADESCWPSHPDLDPGGTLEALHRVRHDLGKSHMGELCVDYALGSGMVDSIVIGIESPSQLQHTMLWFKGSRLTLSEVSHLEASVPEVPEWLLNPSNWS